jgi:hypothetical protein
MNRLTRECGRSRMIRAGDRRIIVDRRGGQTELSELLSGPLGDSYHPGVIRGIHYRGFAALETAAVWRRRAAQWLHIPELADTFKQCCRNSIDTSKAKRVTTGAMP